MVRRAAGAMFIALVLELTPARIHAQVSAGMRAQDIAINSAIGAVTAAGWSLVRGRGFKRDLVSGITRGLVGGAAMGVGRQIAASPFDGSGFIGREVSSAGISLISSAGTDRTVLSFPVGPVRLQLVDGTSFDWRVNATDAVAAAIRATHSGTRIDAALSLSSGTFVFRDRRQTFHTSSGEADAAEFFESITIARSVFNGTDRPNVLYHENVHVLQNDYLSFAVTNPIEVALLDRTSLGRRIARHIDPGILSVPTNIFANSLVKYPARPWEREANALTPRHDY
ncbi:MAG: hypothetical protein M3Z30_07220 [Gemmatimonadota bacterium]|nr:hypothetical protein [Gemmatimonadota bacterium]